MNRFSKIGLGFGLPLLGFIILQDSVGDFYSSREPINLLGDSAQEEAVAEAEAETEAVEADEPVAMIKPEPEPEPAATAELGFDLAAAEGAMRACKSCHVWDKAQNRTGPHLLGVVGRPIGAVEDYRYSDALMELNAAGEVWTEEALVAWLEDPAGYAPGTKMNYKVRDAEDRALIAAYLAAQPSS